MFLRMEGKPKNAKISRAQVIAREIPEELFGFDVNLTVDESDCDLVDVGEWIAFFEHIRDASLPHRLKSILIGCHVDLQQLRELEASAKQRIGQHVVVQRTIPMEGDSTDMQTSSAGAVRHEDGHMGKETDTGKEEDGGARPEVRNEGVQVMLQPTSADAGGSTNAFTNLREQEAAGGGGGDGGRGDGPAAPASAKLQIGDQFIVLGMGSTAGDSIETTTSSAGAVRHEDGHMGKETDTGKEEDGGARPVVRNEGVQVMLQPTSADAGGSTNAFTNLREQEAAGGGGGDGGRGDGPAAPTSAKLQIGDQFIVLGMGSTAGDPSPIETTTSSAGAALHEDGHMGKGIDIVKERDCGGSGARPVVRNEGVQVMLQPTSADAGGTTNTLIDLREQEAAGGGGGNGGGGGGPERLIDDGVDDDDDLQQAVALSLADFEMHQAVAASMADLEKSRNADLDKNERSAHVFVDNSNTFRGSQNVKNADGKSERDRRVKINIQNLVKRVEGGRDIRERVVLGSTKGADRWKTDWEKCGYTVHLQDLSKMPWQRGEQLVDDALIAQMLNSVLEFQDRTLVLLTGDGNQNHGRASFLGAVEKALRRGWKVELWCWQLSTSRNWLRFENEYRGLFKLNYLDHVREQITYLDNARDHGKTSRPSHSPAGRGKPKAHSPAKSGKASTSEPAGGNATVRRPGTPPPEYICPISLSIMKDPVSTRSGHTYERRDIEDWVGRRATSPKTNEPLSCEDLRPNHALRALIEDWKQTKAAPTSPALERQISQAPASEGCAGSNPFDGITAGVTPSPISAVELAVRMLVGSGLFSGALATGLNSNGKRPREDDATSDSSPHSSKGKHSQGGRPGSSCGATRGRGTPSEGQKSRVYSSCPRGHRMRMLDTDAYRCDVCDRGHNKSAKEKRLGCRQNGCEYDVCSDCRKSTCPAGHILQKRDTGGRYECDMCGNRNEGVRLCCKEAECDYDVCTSCKRAEASGGPRRGDTSRGRGRRGKCHRGGHGGGGGRGR